MSTNVRATRARMVVVVKIWKINTNVAVFLVMLELIVKMVRNRPLTIITSNFEDYIYTFCAIFLRNIRY